MDAKNTGKDIAQRIADATKISPFLNTKRAAFYLKLSVRALEQMRADNTGPAWRRHGKRDVAYHIDDLDAWSLSRRSQQASRVS